MRHHLTVSINPLSFPDIPIVKHKCLNDYFIHGVVAQRELQENYGEA